MSLHSRATFEVRHYAGAAHLGRQYRFCSEKWRLSKGFRRKIRIDSGPSTMASGNSCERMESRLPAPLLKRFNA
jgi:hypothetical protein